ncbi:hypothetical protein [Nocardia nova]|uniref:hypothetical protein n=1 Tax=Nocardia nova TaxID=37330 RepID=UPI0027390F26|nr:hypothetical protein [Nocardia nova]
MAKRHKYADANLAVDSGLSSQRIAELSKYVSENIKSGVTGVRFEGAGPGRTNFSVRGWGNHVEYLTFHVRISDAPHGATVRTRIDSYKTTQQTYMMIPISPKSMSGYSLYKRFMFALADAIRAEDPAATIAVTERVQ